MISTRGGFDSISALPIGHGMRSRSYRTGRVCSSDGCGTVLSRYNPTAHCSVHEHLH
jgi:hypothetical protein